jgi:hypothetical protein
MTPTIEKELAAIQRLSCPALRARYAEVFGEEARTKNKVWLLKRIAWRIQALAEGDLSERARQRAAELANDADLRTTLPKAKATEPAPARTVTQPAPAPSDERLPPAGTILTRAYKGRTLQVKMLANGFEHEGEVYASLSAVAKAITGSHCNGFLFFHLTKKETAG